MFYQSEPFCVVYIINGIEGNVRIERKGTPKIKRESLWTKYKIALNIR